MQINSVKGVCSFMKDVIGSTWSFSFNPDFLLKEIISIESELESFKEEFKKLKESCLGSIYSNFEPPVYKSKFEIIFGISESIKYSYSGEVAFNPPLGEDYSFSSMVEEIVKKIIKFVMDEIDNADHYILLKQIKEVTLLQITNDLGNSIFKENFPYSIPGDSIVSCAMSILQPSKEDKDQLKFDFEDEESEEEYSDIEDPREESPSESEQKKKDSRIYYCNAEISHEAIEEFLQTTMKKLKEMCDKLESK